jgi:hypothetical protein
MTKTTKFSIEEVNRLRQRAQGASEVPIEGPQGWSKSEADPMKLLAVFSSLRLKEGLILRAYQFRERGNGNGIVWAMPADAPFPEPEECPKLEDRFLGPPYPPGAFDDVLEAIEGDGSPWSYLSASLFAREAAEFGAMWHGCDWSTHAVIGGDPWESPQFADEESMLEALSSHPDDWEWLEDKPMDWQIQVSEGNDIVTVAFYTHSALGQETIYGHIDTYKQGSYLFKSEKKVVARGPGGYVF